MFTRTAELVIPTGIQTDEANAGVKTQPVAVEATISKSIHNRLIALYSKYIVSNSLICEFV